MGTMKNEMQKAGFVLNEEDSKKVKSSLASMKKKYRRATCRKCGGDIQFVSVDNKMIPHDLEGVPHWQSCPYSSFSQKKASLSIMKKLAILFVVKYGLDLEAEAGITPSEAQVVHAVLEKAFKEPKLEVADTVGAIANAPTEEDVQDDLKAADEASVEDKVETEVEDVKGDDPIGDPDEDLAPSEDAIKEEAGDVETSTEE